MRRGSRKPISKVQKIRKRNTYPALPESRVHAPDHQHLPEPTILPSGQKSGRPTGRGTAPPRSPRREAPDGAPAETERIVRQSRDPPLGGRIRNPEKDSRRKGRADSREAEGPGARVSGCPCYRSPKRKHLAGREDHGRSPKTRSPFPGRGRIRFRIRTTAPGQRGASGFRGRIGRGAENSD